MNTRCKFKCRSVTQNSDGTQGMVFETVTNGSSENESFFKYTPAGHLTLDVVNENVKFTAGKEYYLDISEA